jgi:hypothetical protein
MMTYFNTRMADLVDEATQLQKQFVTINTDE